MIEIFLASILLGIITGLLGGLFGIGGGSVIVPVLALLFTAQGYPANNVMLMAVATSLAAIIFTALSSVAAHHRLGSVLWDKVYRLTPGIILGSMLGAVVAEYISAKALHYIVALFLFYVGIQIALQIKPKSGTVKQSKAMDHGVAVIIGIASAIVGIGGGSLTVPYLVQGSMPMRNAVAIASACGLPIAVAGTISYIVLGWNDASLPEWSLGYVYLPALLGVSLTSVFTAPLGAKLAHILPAAKLKRYFSLLLIFMAVKMVWNDVYDFIVPPAVQQTPPLHSTNKPENTNATLNAIDKKHKAKTATKAIAKKSKPAVAKKAVKKPVLKAKRTAVKSKKQIKKRDNNNRRR